MTAIDFLETPKITLYSASKLANKRKRKEAQEKRKFTQLQKPQQIKLRKHITWIANSVEFISDNIDEINSVLPGQMTKVLLSDLQRALFPIIELFVLECASSEEEEMDRIKQQKEFERFMTTITELSPKQYDLLVNYAENLKFKK